MAQNHPATPTETNPTGDQSAPENTGDAASHDGANETPNPTQPPQPAQPSTPEVGADVDVTVVTTPDPNGPQNEVQQQPAGGPELTANGSVDPNETNDGGIDAPGQTPNRDLPGDGGLAGREVAPREGGETADEEAARLQREAGDHDPNR